MRAANRTTHIQLAVLASLLLALSPALAQTNQTATHPPGADAAPSVASNRDMPAVGPSAPPRGTAPAGPGQAASPSLAARQGRHHALSHNTSAPRGKANPGAAAAPSLEHAAGVPR
jgi:hypothetical protein